MISVCYGARCTKLQITNVMCGHGRTNIQTYIFVSNRLHNIIFDLWQQQVQHGAENSTARHVPIVAAHKSSFGPKG